MVTHMGWWLAFRWSATPHPKVGSSTPQFLEPPKLSQNYHASAPVSYF